MSSIDLYNYYDYRAYLKDRFQYEKAKSKKFTLKAFAKEAGFGSIGYLKMVMDGQRNLTPKSIHKMSKGFRLDKNEAAYFEALVLFNQAKSDLEQESYLQRMFALAPSRKKVTGVTKDKYEYFTNKNFVFIREMVALPHFREDPKWIAKQFSPHIDPKEAEHALEVLLRLKLVKRDRDGQLVQSDEALTTPAEVQALEIFKYHNQMMHLGQKAMMEVPGEWRDISALSFPISLKLIPKVKKEIEKFRESLVELIHKEEAGFDEVYQLNIHCFPATRISGKIEDSD